MTVVVVAALFTVRVLLPLPAKKPPSPAKQVATPAG
jgi:hypothetical protein